MSITRVNVTSPSNVIIFTDNVMGNAVDGIKSTSAVCLWVTVDNTLNASAASYVKLYNATSGSITVGVTAPDHILYCPAGVLNTFQLWTGAVLGVTFGTALSACCVTTGGTAGTISPAYSVTCSVAYQ